MRNTVILIQPIIFGIALLIAIYFSGRELDWLNIISLDVGVLVVLALFKLLILCVCFMICVLAVTKVLFFPNFFLKARIS